MENITNKTFIFVTKTAKIIEIQAESIDAALQILEKQDRLTWNKYMVELGKMAKATSKEKEILVETLNAMHKDQANRINLIPVFSPLGKAFAESEGFDKVQAYIKTFEHDKTAAPGNTQGGWRAGYYYDRYENGFVDEYIEKGDRLLKNMLSIEFVNDKALNEVTTFVDVEKYIIENLVNFFNEISTRKNGFTDLLNEVFVNNPEAKLYYGANEDELIKEKDSIDDIIEKRTGYSSIMEALSTSGTNSFRVTNAIMVHAIRKTCANDERIKNAIKSGGFDDVAINFLGTGLAGLDERTKNQLLYARAGIDKFDNLADVFKTKSILSAISHTSKWDKKDEDVTDRDVTTATLILEDIFGKSFISEIKKSNSWAVSVFIDELAKSLISKNGIENLITDAGREDLKNRLHRILKAEFGLPSIGTNCLIGAEPRIRWKSSIGKSSELRAVILFADIPYPTDEEWNNIDYVESHIVPALTGANTSGQIQQAMDMIRKEWYNDRHLDAGHHILSWYGQDYESEYNWVYNDSSSLFGNPGYSGTAISHFNIGNPNVSILPKLATITIDVLDVLGQLKLLGVGNVSKAKIKGADYDTKVRSKFGNAEYLKISEDYCSVTLSLFGANASDKPVKFVRENIEGIEDIDSICKVKVLTVAEAAEAQIELAELAMKGQKNAQLMQDKMQEIAPYASQIYNLSLWVEETINDISTAGQSEAIKQELEAQQMEKMRELELLKEKQRSILESELMETNKGDSAKIEYLISVGKGSEIEDDGEF